MMDKEKIIVKVITYVSVVITMIWVLLYPYIKDAFVNEIYILFPPSIITLSSIFSYGILWLIKNKLWKWKYTRTFFGNMHDLSGEWDVIRKRYDEKYPENRIAIIEHKWDNTSSMSYRMGTTKLTSTLLYFKKENNNLDLIVLMEGVYDPERNKNPDKEGKLRVTISLQYDSNEDELVGDYWAYTNKVPKQGTLVFKRKSNTTNK